MSDPHIRAAFYLSPTLDAFWRWSRDGEVLTWADDTTIAFRPEIEAVVRRLAPGGLPPFGAVALLVAACRDGWVTSAGRETIEKYANWFGSMSTETSAGGAMHGVQLVFGRMVRDVRLLLDGLDAVSKLPPDQRQGIEAKALLAEVVFEAARNRSTPADAELVIRALEEGIDPDTLRPQLSNEELLSQFACQVDGLHEGLARVDPETLAHRARTGIDQPVSPAPDDLSPPQRVRQLLAELRDDPELAGLAQLAADLMAAVGVPRKLRFHDELSLGGVSDISNRGPLDRLLISELAHDDLTLAVRVAVNEALYLRRETPPREPPHRRAILIDSGIRMWGVPRVFAAAVALAMTALHDPKAELATFRATLSGLTPVDLTRRDGLESHLGALEPAPHPGASLVEFARNANDHEAGECDPILITHPDVLADPEFRAAIHAANLNATYVATVDREGTFRLHALTGKGILLIREAVLSLDAILNPRPAKRRPVPLVTANQKLPAIFYADPFPLLLFHAPIPKLACASKAFGLIAATRDGRVMQWTSRDYGARQLTSALPRGRIRLIFLDRYFRQVKVLTTHHSGSNCALFTVDLQSNKCNSMTITLREPNPRAAYYWKGGIYFVYPSRVDCYDISRGMLAGSVSAPLRHVRERFFRLVGEMVTVAFDGSPELKVQQWPTSFRAVPIDREGFDPGMLTFDGRFIEANGSEHRPRWPSAFQELLGISADGHRLAARLQHGVGLLDLTRPEEVVELIQGPWAAALFGPEIEFAQSSVNPRNQFHRISVDRETRLCLHKGRQTFRLDFTGKFPLFKSESIDPVVPANARRFEPLPDRGGTRIKMSRARWADGSQAWLDRRGLLHLRSSDRSVPELTITLSNCPPAFWSSDGKMCGPNFFIGGAVPTEAAYFRNVVNGFMARVR